MLGHARCVATNVSELGLRKEEDDVPPRKGDVIGNGTVLAWHGTLEKLTEALGLAGRHGPQVRLALLLLASIVG